MLSRWRGGVTLLAFFLIIGRTFAQSNCPALVQAALQSVATSCESLGRNQACYGNLSLHATAQPDAPIFAFEHVGDVVDVLHIQTLTLDPLDEARGVWGLAMMQLQADIPDTLPGQNVTFLLFGDVEIENRATAGQTPMQAFYLRSGVGDAGCVEAPESGVLIQTPHGVESVSFNINGVDVEVGSTIMLQAQPAGDFTIRTLEGAAVVTMDGSSYPVIAGTQMTMPVDEQMQPAGAPSLPTALTDVNLDALPIAPLPREIPPPAPLPDAALMKLQMRVEEGLEPCGVPGLPECDHALAPDEQRVWATESSFAPAEMPESDIIVQPTLPLEGNPELPMTLPETGGENQSSNNGAPNNPPGQSNNPPGPPDNPPGQSNNPPGPPDNPPGQSNNPPSEQPPPPGNPPGPPDNPPSEQSENKDKKDKDEEKKDKDEKDKDKKDK